MVTLSDGSELRAEPYHYIEVTQPSDFVYGVGEQIDRKTGKHTPFAGMIHPTAVDSINFDTLNMAVGDSRIKRRVQYYVLGLSDSSQVRCQKSDCVIVDSRDGAGLWCVGQLESHRIHSGFSGRIPFENIRKIEVREFSVAETVVLVTVTAVVVAGIIAVAWLGSHAIYSLR